MPGLLAKFRFAIFTSLTDCVPTLQVGLQCNFPNSYSPRLPGERSERLEFLAAGYESLVPPVAGFCPELRTQ